MDRTFTASQIHEMVDPFKELAGKWITHIGDTAFNPPMPIEHVGTYAVDPEDPHPTIAADFTVWPKSNQWMVGISITSNSGIGTDVTVQITDSEPREPHTPGDYGNADPV